jgi:spore maturation protein CgeB
MLRRVLIAYTSRPPIIQYLSAAFARRGIEVRAVFADENTWFDRLVIHHLNKLAHNFRIIPKSKNFFEDRPASHMNFRSARLRDAIAAYDPDLVFHIRGLGFRDWAFDGARRKFAWWVESDERLKEALGEVPWFDHYFFINSASVAAAQRAGYAHASYLPHAVDASVFRPLPKVVKDIDFAFVGLWSERREQFLDAALEVSQNGALYGPKWFMKTFHDRRFRRILKGSYIADEPLVRLYNRAKVVLNITSWGAGGGAARSGLTMRLFEVPATGSFLLTDPSAELGLSLKAGVHVDTFSDVESFKKKLRFYLDYATERQKIAVQGLQHVRAHHSYDCMVDSILAACEHGRHTKE